MELKIYSAGSFYSMTGTSPTDMIGVGSSGMIMSFDGEYHTPTPVVSPTPLPPTPTLLPLGVRIGMPTRRVQPGEYFWVTGFVDNRGSSRIEQVPLFYVLDIFGYYYFWPSWRLYHPPESLDVDFRVIDIDPGSTMTWVVQRFTWPDTGDDSATGLYFYGALLDPAAGSLLGEIAVAEWGYGPP